MLTDHLKKIAATVIEKTNELISHSTNLDNEGKKINDANEMPWQRFVYRSASLARTKNDTYGVIQQIYDWHVDLSNEKSSEFFKNFYLENEEGKTEHLITYLSNLNIFAGKNEGRNTKFLKQNQPLRACEEIAANAVRFNIGNCYEKAILATILFREYPIVGSEGIDQNVSVTLMQCIPPRKQVDNIIIDKSHTFLILNLTQGDPNKPETWNDDALICDPWKKEVYTIGEARQTPKEFPIWQDILEYQKYLKKFPLDSNVGSKFNNEPHSNEWNKRAAKLVSQQSEKWWKSNNFFDQKRPPLSAEVEEKHLNFKK